MRIRRTRGRTVAGAILFLALAIAAFAILGAERNGVSRALPDLPADAGLPAQGAAAFIGESFGGISQAALETNAVPWKLMAAALVLDEQARDPTAVADQATLRRIMKRFGFLYPSALVGVPGGIEGNFAAKPLGMTHGTIAPLGGAQVEVANLGCSACHAGVAYDAKGIPDPSRAIPGMPNTSLDLEAYTQAIFEAMRRQTDDDALLAMADHLFPDMAWSERTTLRWLVLTLARKRLRELAGEDRPMPFPNGLPGATNGVAALKQRSGTPLAGGGAQDRGFVSVPELALRNRRPRLLADGAYATPSGTNDGRELAAITSFFTVPSMGVDPAEALRHIPQAEAIFAWLATYRPMPFPGPVDLAEARRGETVYSRACAECHGTFVWDSDRPKLASYPNWVGDVGTDRLRALLFDEALVKAIERSKYAETIRLRVGEGYTAPPLAGLWSSAPYLHNGSVPSLTALLEPRLRPARFRVGGHALDWTTMGLRLGPDGGYPVGYVPYSTPQWVDTGQPGLGNSGHEYGGELSTDERRALIEFLKLL